jgi:hypothetical protein
VARRCGLLLAALLGSGCAREAERTAALRPPDPDMSRTALTTALDAWKSGRRVAGALLGDDPAVGVVDTLQADRPLVDYEILGALGTLPEARPFAVRLELDDPRESITTRYMVLGKNPLWVFRQEDYELILHWEHKMSAEEHEGESEPEAESPHDVGR